MNCKKCGIEIKLGSPITEDCDDCIRAYVSLRNTAIASGSQPTPLLGSIRLRCDELGILVRG